MLTDFQAVKEAYCQGFNHNHIGEIADHKQQMAIGPYATDYRPSNNADQKVAETSGTAICNQAVGQSYDESTVSQGAVHTAMLSKEACHERAQHRVLWQASCLRQRRQPGRVVKQLGPL